MAITCLGKFIFLYIVLTSISEAKDDDELKDFDFSSGGDVAEEREMMIAQESRQYKTMVKAPIRIVKPNGITNSHRPQYNLDSFEDDYIERKYKGNEADDMIDFFEEPTTKRYMEKDYKQSYKLRSKEAEIRNAVLRALGRKDHVGKFAQILPIIRAMSPSQRIALASLVANQVTTPPGRSPLNLAQVRSMFGNNDNTTTSLMLPILLDMANLIRRSVRSHKETRDVKQPPLPQMLRRSFTEEDDDTFLDADPFERGYVQEVTTSTTTNAPTTRQTNTQRSRNRNTPRNRPQKVTDKPNTDKINVIEKKPESLLENVTVEHKNTSSENVTNNVEHDTLAHNIKKSANISMPQVASTVSSLSKLLSDNSSMDLTADSTNHTISQNLPVAEKLRSINKYVDRKAVSLIRRGQRPFVKPSPPPSVTRRTTAESTLTPFRRRPMPARKLPTTADHAKCELFTNSLCLHSDDYPTEAIVLSIRHNKAAAGALLADFRDPGNEAIDGVTAAQEAKYTAEHYLTSNRRGDTANRDFASAGEAGFMCPSTVKYARPQRARATSGQWKYIVNTGEHTQTLRLEKCLKPKEPCTYLTDNFKSKCVQVYNYHRLLTWDQQNGLHMDIFKVPTCCSCHIEGYSVAFPPLGHRIQETSSEQFPGEDLSPDHGNKAFESVQSSIQRPSITKKNPYSNLKPIESFHSFSDNHNLISGAGLSNSKLSDNEEGNSANIAETAPMDSYGNSYYPDSFNQATNIRSVKRPPGGRIPTATGNFDSVTLPSYLEPPTPSSGVSFSFGNDKSSKYKTTGNQFKRGTRPNRRPIRKKISTTSDDLMSSGTSAVESLTNGDEEYDDIPEDIHESLPVRGVTNNPKGYVTQPPKVMLVDKKPTTFKPDDQSRPVTSKGKRVNYNYHPIIDFFESDGREEEEDEYPTIDRDDSVAEIVASPESEWKPINLPVTRGTQSANLIGRKKH